MKTEKIHVETRSVASLRRVPDSRLRFAFPVATDNTKENAKGGGAMHRVSTCHTQYNIIFKIFFNTLKLCGPGVSHAHMQSRHARDRRYSTVHLHKTPLGVNQWQTRCTGMARPVPPA
ncbi:MAG: hypothetical protein LBL33_03475 [Tannerella sp.]|nr:hypothetical protein [Tannerella sp.]